MANGDIPTKNGNPPFPVRGNGTFWASWARQIIAFVFGALTAAYVVGGKSEVLNDLTKRMAKVETVQERMDTTGTNRSHWRDDEQDRSILSNLAAIEELKKKIEPVGVMQVKIEKLEQRAISEDTPKR